MFKHFNHKQKRKKINVWKSTVIILKFEFMFVYDLILFEEF